MEKKASILTFHKLNKGIYIKLLNLFGIGVRLKRTEEEDSILFTIDIWTLHAYFTLSLEP